MLLTVEQFAKLFPCNKEAEAWTAAINAICPLWTINTPLRLAAFLAECGHESDGFTDLTENLNYSATALLQFWPKRFTPATAQEFARHPEKIANHVYANRLGNGDEASGDGWRYRGYGPIQITGKGNRQDFARAIGKTLEEAEAYILTHEGGIASACWYWTTRNINRLADSRDIVGCSKAVNGGTNGLAERKALYAKAADVLGIA